MVMFNCMCARYLCPFVTFTPDTGDVKAYKLHSSSAHFMIIVDYSSIFVYLFIFFLFSWLVDWCFVQYLALCFQSPSDETDRDGERTFTKKKKKNRNTAFA